MGSIRNESNQNFSETDNDRMKELKSFDDTKMGVKGLVDSGVKTIPKMFIRPVEELLEEEKTPCVKLQIPVVDLEGVVKKDGYNEIAVKQIYNALEEWGFFQIVNHGIPHQVIDNMIEGMKKFHEQDAEAKKLLYTRDMTTKTVSYQSNFDLYQAKSASWRDTFAVHAKNSLLDPMEIPEICREAVMEYINHLLKLGETLMELISVSLGLRPSYLKEVEVSKGWDLANHYYPACPNPELTQGTCKHTDPSFITILLQDQIGGLQVLHDDKWVPVEPIPHAFVINIGDILQMVTNDKFKSVYHRVRANKVGPRISVAMFLKGDVSSSNSYGPIKELSSENNPPIYRDFTPNEFVTRYFNRPFGEHIFEYFKIKNEQNSG